MTHCAHLYMLFEWVFCSQEMWQQELQDIKQRRKDLLLEDQQMQKISPKLQSWQDKKKQCQKEMAKWVGDREKARNEIQERHAQMSAIKKLRRHLGRKQNWTRISKSCKQETTSDTVFVMEGRNSQCTTIKTGPGRNLHFI